MHGYVIVISLVIRLNKLACLTGVAELECVRSCVYAYMRIWCSLLMMFSCCCCCFICLCFRLFVVVCVFLIPVKFGLFSFVDNMLDQIALLTNLCKLTWSHLSVFSFRYCKWRSKQIDVHVSLISYMFGRKKSF